MALSSIINAFSNIGQNLAKPKTIIKNPVTQNGVTTTTNQTQTPTNSLDIAKNNYLNKYTNQINSSYSALKNNVAGLYDADKQILKQNFDNYKSQESVNALKNQLALKETMAKQGLFNSGDNITEQARINNTASKNISQLSTEQANQQAKIMQQIAQSQNGLDQQQAAALQSAMYNADQNQYRDDAFDYQKGRDSLLDTRYTDTTQYNRGRDTMLDQRYKDQFDYQKGRDSITDSHWNSDFNFKADRAKVEDGQWGQQFNADTNYKNASLQVQREGNAAQSSLAGAQLDWAKTQYYDTVNRGQSAQASDFYSNINASLMSTLNSKDLPNDQKMQTIEMLTSQLSQSDIAWSPQKQALMDLLNSKYQSLK